MEKHSQNPIEIKSKKIIYDYVEINESQNINWFRDIISKILPQYSEILTNRNANKSKIYQYPKVQYRIENDKAAIVGFQEGCDVLDKIALIGALPTTFLLGRQEIDYYIERLGLEANFQKYHIPNWVAFINKQIDKWDNAYSYIEKKELLEKTIRANLLALCNGFKYFIPAKGMVVNILDFKEVEVTTDFSETNKVELYVFEVLFETNINIPINLGLGPKISKGYGMQQKCEENITKLSELKTKIIDLIHYL